VPILVHDPEGYRFDNESRTEAANPPGLARAYMSQQVRGRR
jgi:hypothetical protein